MSEWQPIETAPKDGTWVLLYSPDNEPSVATCCWESLNYNWAPQWVWGSKQRADFRGGFYGATHWMPLPEPPRLDRQAPTVLPQRPPFTYLGPITAEMISPFSRARNKA